MIRGQFTNRFELRKGTIYLFFIWYCASSITNFVIDLTLVIINFVLRLSVAQTLSTKFNFAFRHSFLIPRNVAILSIRLGNIGSICLCLISNRAKFMVLALALPNLWQFLLNLLLISLSRWPFSIKLGGLLFCETKKLMMIYSMTLIAIQINRYVLIIHSRLHH